MEKLSRAVFIAIVAFTMAACATVPSKQASADGWQEQGSATAAAHAGAVAPQPPEIAVDLPAGWTLSRHPGMYTQDETKVYVNEGNITQLSVWIVPPTEGDPIAITRKMLADADHVIGGGNGTWNGLRWAGFRGEDTGEEIGSYALCVVREMRGTPFLLVTIGIWPKWVDAMRQDVNAVIARIHVAGLKADGQTYDWLPVNGRGLQ